MANTRTIILTGAGAAIPWGAPSTWNITKELLQDTTFRSYTGQPLGDWLYYKLTGLYHKDPNSVNFETIINSLEYLITYFSSKQRESFSQFKNLMPAFFQEKEDLYELLWFDRIYEKKNDMWQSHNPKYNSYPCWNDYDDFFEVVFRYFINRIVSLVKNYSQKVNEYSQLNNQLHDFLISIKNPLRCYTTNYDRIIPVIYQGYIFEGFSQKDGENRFDLQKVLTDESSNIYYNLHGSVHYDLDWPGNVKYCPDKYIYNFGHSATDHSDQDRKMIINSNIITGFNKPSRILSNPYLQFYLRFCQDCLFADKIYVIGYSFSDIHINKAIKTASLANKNLKIICVSYMVYDGDNDVAEKYDWIELKDRGDNFLNENFRHNIYGAIVDETNVNRIFIYRKGFQKFLEKQQWTK